MPAPSAPTSLTVLARAEGNTGVSPFRGDAILLGCDVVAGATSYVFHCDELGDMESGHPFSIGGLALPPLNAVCIPDPTTPLKGVVATTVLHNFKVKARNASGDSAWYVPGLDITARTLTAINAASTADLTAPTLTGFSCDGAEVTATYDFSSSGEREYSLNLVLYDAAGTVVVATSVLDSALCNQATGRTIKVTAPALNADYVLKMTATGFNSSNAAIVKTSATTLSIHVPNLAITPRAARVAQGQPFALTLTAADTSTILSPSSIPAGTALSAKSGTDPQIFTGVLDTLGPVDCIFAALVGTSTGFLHLALEVVVIIDVPAEIAAWKADEIFALASYGGLGTVSSWFLTNCPPGVTTGAITVTGAYHDVPAANVVAIAGAPSASGVFEATLAAIAVLDGVPSLWSVPVRFIVSGDLFLGWFHDDPDRIDLQLMLRSKEVLSYAAADAATLVLTRGDDEKLYVIVRDGPIAEGVYGREIIADGFTELRLVVRPPDDLDAEPYLDLGGAVVTEVIDGNTVFTFTFPVTSDPIEEAFTALNAAPGAEPGAAVLKGAGELAWIRNGRARSSRSIPTLIVQDDER